MALNDAPQDIGLEDLRESVESAREVMQDISRELKRLDRKSMWNRAISVIVCLALAGVLVLSILFWRESRQQDARFEQTLLDSCERGNNLRLAIIEEQNRFVEALAAISEAPPDVVMRFQEDLENRRSGALNLTDCASFISNND